MRIRSALAVAMAAALALGGCTSAASDQPTSPVVISMAPREYKGGTSLPDGYAMPDVTLTDTAGKPYNLLTDPTTPVVLVFFGYSNCPDVCTGILSDVAVALQRSPAEISSKVTQVLVTTDPARDTPEVLSTYLSRIDPSIVGLSGDLDLITTTAQAVGVPIEDAVKLPSGGYEVTHGTQVIGFDSAHRAVVIWTPGTSIGDYKSDIATLVGKQS